MNLVKCCDVPESYLDMDCIEYVVKYSDGTIKVYTANEDYIISESAYNTILKYGKAEV